jgi:hypothetical protein
VEWWDQHTVWWDGRTPLQMEQSGEPRLSICARNWVREVQELRSQLAAIAPAQILELRFEELLGDPLRHLERVLDFLGVEFSASYRAAIESLALRPVRAKWGKEWSGADLERVLEETRPTLRELGYVTEPGHV